MMMLKEKSKQYSTVGHNQISSSTSDEQSECNLSTLNTEVVFPFFKYSLDLNPFY